LAELAEEDLAEHIAASTPVSTPVSPASQGRVVVEEVIHTPT